MKDFAAVEWERARSCLLSAGSLVENDPDSAASRAYYAVFHGVTAFFALRGQAFSKHTAVRASFHRDLIRTGLLDGQRGRDYDFLLDLRETADYGGITRATPDTARSALEKAQALLAALSRICPELPDCGV
ncbi:MAG: HEPN domain-containing protein [Planctomycetes bacterium]|nr:HEPN domain-containing protein [Planctomycetota bacterium]